MRILVLTNLYPPHGYGGYELACRDVVAHWRADGHAVRVVTTTEVAPGVQDGSEEEPEPDVERTLRWYWRRHVLLESGLAAQLATERHDRAVVVHELDTWKPDVVSVWNWGAMPVTPLGVIADRGVPVVHYVCNDWPVHTYAHDRWARTWKRHPRAASIFAKVARLDIPDPDRHRTADAAFLSAWARDAVLARSPWKLRDAGVVHVGIDTATMPIRDDVDDRPWGWRLLYGGRIAAPKGLETLVRSLTHLPEQATARISTSGGDAAHRADLERLIEGLGLRARVRIVDEGRAELREALDTADVLVFPSTWPEPQGLVPFEAMARATAVAATATGGLAELLADGVNGVVFAPGDERALAAAVVRLADDEGLRARVREGGLATARRMPIAETARQLLALLHDARG